MGTDSDTAHQRQLRKLAELRALSQGLLVEDVEEEANKNHVKIAVHEFLEEVKLTKQDKTWRGYKIALQYFQESCDKTHLEEIQRIDLLRFSAFLRDKKKLAPRTIHNKFACVLTFLEAQGVSKLVGKKDRPRFVDQDVEIYEDGDGISTLLPMGRVFVTRVAGIGPSVWKTRSSMFWIELAEAERIERSNKNESASSPTLNCCWLSNNFIGFCTK